MVMYDKYVNNQFTLEEIDNNILTEYARQRMFLERKVDDLSKKLYQQGETHKELYTRTLDENKTLTKLVHEIRQENRDIKASIKEGGGDKEKSPKEVSEEAPSNQTTLQETPKLNNGDIEKLQSHVKDLEQLLAVQAERIKYLEDQLDNTQKVQLRPKSRQELPPMDSNLK